MKVLFVGTFTEQESHSAGEGKGIHVFKYHVDRSKKFIEWEKGELIPTEISGSSPAFLCLSHHKKTILAVNEVSSKPKGTVTVLDNSSRDGCLRKVTQLSTNGAGPCFVTTTSSDCSAFVCNFFSGSLCTYSLKSSEWNTVNFIQLPGSGSRVLPIQNKPRAHCIAFDEEEKFAYAADLGSDQIWSFRNVGNSNLVAEKSTALANGSGPRHIRILRNLLYVSCQLNGTVSVLKIDSAGGVKQMQTISTLPQAFSGTNDVAELAFSKNRKFLYVSNRGHDSLAIFSIGQNGRLQLVAHQVTMGKCPRHFAIDYDEGVLWVANQDSSCIVPFWMNEHSGMLEFAGFVIDCPSPSCVLIDG